MAVTFDAAAGQKVTGSSTNTFSHTVDNQSNRILWVPVDAGASVNSVKYGGVSLTQLSSNSGQGGGEVLSLWYLLAPAIGTANIVITCSSATYIIGASASYYNVAQSSTFGTAASNSGTGATSSTNTVVTTSSSQLVFDTVNNTGAATDTATASQTKRFQPTSSGVAIGDIAATGSNMTLTWSWSGSATWAQISVAMNVAGGATLSGTLAGVGTLSGTLSASPAVLPPGYNVQVNNQSVQKACLRACQRLQACL